MVRLKLRFGSTIQAKLIESRSSGEPRALVTAPDVYPYYYPVVVRYYERLTQEHPDYSYYWYYLAEAQYRAGMPEAALCRSAKHLRSQNPTRRVKRR